MPSILSQFLFLLFPEIHKFSALSDRATGIYGSIPCSAHPNERKIHAKQSKSALLFGNGTVIAFPSRTNGHDGMLRSLFVRRPSDFEPISVRISTIHPIASALAYDWTPFGIS
jgi:hypothetical protein